MMNEDPILVRDLIAALSHFPGDCEVAIYGDVMQEVEIRVYEPGTTTGVDIYRSDQGLLV